MPGPSIGCLGYHRHLYHVDGRQPVCRWDASRDHGFSIFYIGVDSSALAAPFCGKWLRSTWGSLRYTSKFPPMAALSTGAHLYKPSQGGASNLASSRDAQSPGGLYEALYDVSLAELGVRPLSPCALDR